MLILSPIYYLFFALLSSIYQQRIYRKVVIELDHHHFIDLLEIQSYNIVKTKKKMIDYPLYIEEAIEYEKTTKSSQIKMIYDKFFFENYPSIYEDLIICGSSGFQLILSYLQVISFSFVVWIALFVLREYRDLIEYEDGLLIPIFVIALIIYNLTIPYLVCANLNILTLISSVICV